MRAIDLTGQRFGRLIVLRRTDSNTPSGKRKAGRVSWTCICDCGGYIDTLSSSLVHNKTRSCGCLKRESVRVNGLKRRKTDSESLRKSREKMSETRLRGHLRRKFGITLDTYKKMTDDQDQKCAICKKERGLSVDHSHITGKVRGLLCGSCNRALGLLQDDPDVARNAVNYLLKWRHDESV
jgi:hypothetical protein